MFFCQIHQRLNPSHDKTCPACLERKRQDDFTESLLRKRAVVINDQSSQIPGDFMSRLATRIRMESEPILTSWEAAILSLRGWAFTCSAAVLLLIAIAVTVLVNDRSSDELIFTASASESVSHEAFWSGE